MANRVGKHKRRMKNAVLSGGENDDDHNNNDRNINISSSHYHHPPLHNHHQQQQQQQQQAYSTKNSNSAPPTFLRKKKRKYMNQQSRNTATKSTNSSVRGDDDNDPFLNIFSESYEKFLSTDKSLGTIETFYYALSTMHPHEIRNERLILLSESYAIFGGLFLNGIWFIWEYGSSKEFDNSVVETIFEVSCCVAMIATVLLAMFASFVWQLSTMFANQPNNPNFAFSARGWLSDMHIMQFVIFQLTVLSLCLGAYNRLDNNILGIVVAGLTFIYVFALMQRGANDIFVNEIPLEMYHFPWYFKGAFSLVLWYRRNDIPRMARQRSELLRNDFEKERKKQQNQKKEDNKNKNRKQTGGGGGGKARTVVSNASNNNNNNAQFASNNTIKSITTIEELLREGCRILGKDETQIDLTPYLLKLQEDWYDTVGSLIGLNVDKLHRYMPGRLAEITYELLLEVEESLSDGEKT